MRHQPNEAINTECMNYQARTEGLHNYKAKGQSLSKYNYNPKYRRKLILFNYLFVYHDLERVKL